MGMNPFLFMERRQADPCDVLQLAKLQVVAQRTFERDGYTSCLQLSQVQPRLNGRRKPLRGHFAAAKLEPKRKGRGIPHRPRTPC